MKLHPDANPVLVIWEDAWSSRAHVAAVRPEGAKKVDTPSDDIMPPCLRYTVGFIVQQDDDAIVIGATLDPPHPSDGMPDTISIEDLLRIPRGMVRKVIKLCPVSPSRRSRSNSRSPSSSRTKSSSPPSSEPSSSEESSSSDEPLSDSVDLPTAFLRSPTSQE